MLFREEIIDKKFRGQLALREAKRLIEKWTHHSPGLFEWIIDWLRRLIQRVINIVNNVLAWFRSRVQLIINHIKSAIARVTKALIIWAKKVVGKAIAKVMEIRNWIIDTWNKFYASAKNIIVGLKNRFWEFIASIISKAREIFNNIIKAGERVFEKIKARAIEIVTKLANNVKEKITLYIEELREKIYWLKSFFQEFLKGLYPLFSAFFEIDSSQLFAFFEDFRASIDEAKLKQISDSYKVGE